MNCDAMARWYRVLEYLAFGHKLEKVRFEFLEDMVRAKRVLILGDGDGRFTSELVRQNPGARIDFVDASARMVELAQARTGGVHFRVGDARTAGLDGPYDLVVTHFFLDCFWDEELPQLVARIAAACAPGARWVVSEFALPSAGIGRWAARVLIRFMYFFFQLLTGLAVTKLPDYARAMTSGGFRLIEKRGAMGGLCSAEMWELLRAQSNHGIDAGGAPGGQPGS